MPDTIICPKCSYEIEVTEVFSAQLRTQLHVDDLYENGRTLWLRLHEKGGKYPDASASQARPVPGRIPDRCRTAQVEGRRQVRRSNSSPI